MNKKKNKGKGKEKKRKKKKKEMEGKNHRFITPIVNVLFRVREGMKEKKRKTEGRKCEVICNYMK